MDKDWDDFVKAKNKMKANLEKKYHQDFDAKKEAINKLLDELNIIRKRQREEQGKTCHEMEILRDVLEELEYFRKMKRS